MPASKKNIYPFSPEGVKHIGTEYWLENYESPVTSNLFQNIYDQILKEFISLLPENQDSPVFQVAICNYKFILSLAHKCFFMERLNKLQEKEITHVFESSQITLADARQRLSLATDLDPCFGLDFVNFCRYKWRIIRTNWGNTNPIKAILPRMANHDFYVIGDRNIKELKFYAASSQSRLLTLQPRNFFPSAKLNIPHDEQSDVETFVSRLMDFTALTYPETSDFINNEFRAVATALFTNTLNAIHQCRKKIRSLPAKPILVTGIGNIYHRVFSAAWQTIKKQDVINFTHGNSYCLAYKPGSITTGSHTFIDNYIASSKGEAELLRDASQDFANDLPTFKKVSVNPNNIYRPILDSFKNMPQISKIKRVMLIGYPMSNHYHLYHPEQNSLAQLHLELSLIKKMKQCGFTVIYKAHPDSLNSIRGIYEQYADEIISEPLEQVCREGLTDCVLFGTPSTTTFGYILLTGLPVTVIDTEGTWWHPEVKKLAIKRCSFVPARTDGLGRIVFDSAALEPAIRESVEKTDMEIVNYYALR